MPTHNYGMYIGRAIESLLADVPPGIEILVLDGGSSDRTREVVENLAKGRRFLRYVYQSERGGIDRDLAQAVELASGEYCWLLSADDALAPGALPRILQEFENGSDLLLTNRIWCDVNLNLISRQTWLAGPEEDQLFDFSDDRQISDYLDRASSLGALFSFMSVIGFRRESWLRTKSNPALVASNYAHVERLFSIARNGTRLKYIAAPLVLCRSGNDSFRASGLASRLAIDLRGYLRLSQAIFPDNEQLQKAFRAVVRREHSWRVWMHAREITRDPARWLEVEQLLPAYGFRWMQVLGIKALGLASRLRTRKPAA